LTAAQWRIPIIFITAHDEEEVRARALKAGLVACLHKPFSEAALLEAIRSALESDSDGTSRSS
jgi:FixJ family two-component response regulator